MRGKHDEVWGGGLPVLGYDIGASSKKLVINEEEPLRADRITGRAARVRSAMTCRLASLPKGPSARFTHCDTRMRMLASDTADCRCRD
jgi:hypothetical protein